MGREHLSAYYRGQWLTLPVATVTHFTAGDKYVTAHHPGGELILTDRLANLAAEFPEFIRTHRSVLVRKSLITGFRVHRPDGHAADGGFVQCQGIDELRVTRAQAKAIQALLAA